jgi:hypothetical protein
MTNTQLILRIPTTQHKCGETIQELKGNVEGEIGCDVVDRLLDDEELALGDVGELDGLRAVGDASRQTREAQHVDALDPLASCVLTSTSIPMKLTT